MNRHTYKLFLRNILYVIGIIAICIFSPTKPEQLVQEAKNELIKHRNLVPKSEYAILIDYKKSILKKRLWVINLNTEEVIVNTHVSHARKSGLLWPDSFSNEVGSEFSCTGVFRTLQAYRSNYGKGENAIGMRVQGLESTNNNAFTRNIVFHPSYGLYSKGCFMTLPKINKEIIELTKGGSLVYVVNN